MNATRPVAALLLAACVLLGSLSAPASAAGDAGDVVVTVVDAASGAPVALARVFLQGEGITVGYTDADGRARFESVATGTYRASITKRDFAAARSRLFDVAALRSSDVLVRLDRSGSLRKIGTVSVSSSVARATREVGQEDALRFLDGSLRDAIGDLPGVTSAGDGYAIDGNDPTQTGTTIDGVPVAGAGASLAARGINADLFGGATASSGAVNGSLGGSVDFRSLQPTRLPQQQATLQYGSDDSSAALLVARGSLRNVGYVVEHAVRGRTNGLTGLRYTDQSGETYVHDGDAATSGELAKLRWSPSLAQTLTLTATSTTGGSGVTCAAATALFPCGYGPALFRHQRGALVTLGESATIGATSLFVSGFANASRDDLDASRARFAGAPAPSASTVTTRSRGASLALQLPAGDRHELSLSATAYGVAVDGTDTNGFGTFPLRLRSTFHAARITDRFRPTRRLTIAANAGINGTGDGSAFATRLDVRWQPARDVAYTLGASAGDAGTALAVTGGALPDPRSLTYDCASGTAIGSLPSAAAQRQRSSSLRAGIERSSRRARVALTAWTQYLQGAPVFAATDGAAYGLPPGYGSAVASVAASPYVCGSGAITSLALTSFAPADQRARGVTIAGTLQAGAALFAGYATVQSRFVVAGSPATASLSPAGAQVPGTPLHRAGVVFTTKVGRAVDLLANASYTGGNNASHLPAYTVFNAGFAAPLREGSLALVGTNLTNRFPGPFVTPADALALPRSGAPALALPASPLGPRTVTLTYTVRTGRLGAAGSGAGTAETSAPEASGPVVLRLNDLPDAPPPDALRIDPDNDSCTPAAARFAQPALDAVDVIRAAAERERGGGRYPAALRGMPSGVNGVNLRYVAYDEGARYAVVVRAPIGTASAFLNCARLSNASAEDGAKRHLFFPAEQAKGEFFVAYVPSVGLYAVPPPDTKRSAAPARSEPDPEPAVAPADPFAQRADCPAAFKPVAVALATAVRAARDARRSGSPLPQTDIATIVAHGEPPGAWLEVRTRDMFAVGAAIKCLHVATLAPARLTAAGIRDDRPSGLGFTDRFGFYLIAEPEAPASR